MSTAASKLGSALAHSGSHDQYEQRFAKLLVNAGAQDMLHS